MRIRENVLQVCHNQQWGLACFGRSDWDIIAGSVVCRQLGLSTRGKFFVQ